MAGSPELDKIQESLENARSVMITQYAHFLESVEGGLTPDDFTYILKEGSRVEGVVFPVHLNAQSDQVAYSATFSRHIKVGSTRGYGMKLSRDPDEGVQEPSEIGVIIDRRNPENPLLYERLWDAANSEIIGSTIAADQSHIIKIVQQTRRNLLLIGPEYHSRNPFSPIQGFDISFNWVDGNLRGWVSIFGLTEKEFQRDVYLYLASDGERTTHGNMAEEFMLPESLIVHEVIDNFIDGRPALRGAYYL